MENFLFALLLTMVLAIFIAALLGNWRIIPITLLGIAGYTLTKAFLTNSNLILLPVLAGLGTIILAYFILSKPTKKKIDKDEVNIKSRP